MGFGILENHLREVEAGGEGGRNRGANEAAGRVLARGRYRGVVGWCFQRQA